MFHFQFAIFGDGVMKRDDGGYQFLDLQYSVTEALVVMHQIEIVYSFFQRTMSTNTERARFAKSSL